MRQNIADQITALNDLGFTEVNSSTPLSVIADYMRWGGGLRDLRLATINKNTGAYADYSEEEWNNLSASGKAALIKLGIRIRAERQDFIISKDNITRANGSFDIPWAPNNNLDVKGLTNYGAGATGYLNDIDGEANTDLILAHGIANNITFEAAERARAYKASTFADGGYDDPTKWSLPAIGQLWLLYKYRIKINAAITTFFGASAQLITDSWYWSSTEYNSSYAWNVNMLNGTVNTNLKATTYRVRAVAPVPVASAI
ncbi:MAG: DUF1566 domain-containing protein [Lachnospiraceae bacterium]|nr:DUF1566 domain-containing protein [Lachnospiraceae bacterium]